MAKLTEQEVRIVRAAPMFASLSDEAIVDLAARCGKVRYRPLESICRAGEPAEFFFVILAGHVRSQEPGKGADGPTIRHIRGPGQTLAETAVMKHQLYPCSLDALDEVLLLAIDQPTYDAVLQTNVETVSTLVAELSEKLQELAGLADRQAVEDLAGRVAAELLRRAGTNAPSPSTDELAGTLRAEPPMLDKALLLLSEAGEVRTLGQAVTIRDAEALARRTKQP